MHRLPAIAVSAIGAICFVGVLLAQSDLPVAPPDKAILVVRVPPTAKVTIDGSVTTQEGPERKFITPSLEPGVTYAQEVVARWQEAGQDKSAHKTVSFKAGQTVVVDLTPPRPPKTTEIKKPAPPKVKVASPEPKKPAPPRVKVASPEPKKPAPPKVKVASLEPKKKPESVVKLPIAAPKAEPKKTPIKVERPRTRAFRFSYVARIKELPAGALARVWIPIATSNDQQEVTIAEKYLADAQMAKEPVYGNTMAYFEAPANARGEIPFEVTYDVKRKEVRASGRHGPSQAVATPAQLKRFLEPDTRAPWTGKPLEFLHTHLESGTLPKDSLAAARGIYDALHRHLAYKAADGSAGQGDTAAVVERGYGNGTDLNGLFVALARGHQIAAKLELGFQLPAKPGPVTSSACWAWVLADGHGWVPADLAEARQAPERADYCFGNLSADRVTFSVGRDIELVPRQAGPPLDVFIDPYVEVNGKAYPANKIQRRFSYKALP